MSETKEYCVKALTVMGAAIKKLLSGGYRLDDLRQMNTDVLEGQAGVTFSDKPAGIPPISVEMYLNSGWHRELIEND